MKDTFASLLEYVKAPSVPVKPLLLGVVNVTPPTAASIRNAVGAEEVAGELLPPPPPPLQAVNISSRVDKKLVVFFLL